MSIDYEPIIVAALTQMVAYEQQRLRGSERGADFVFGQFGQLCVMSEHPRSNNNERKEFACVFGGGVFETAFYVTTQSVGDEEWVSLLISVPFVLEATCASDLRVQLEDLVCKGIARRELVRTAQDRNEAYSDLYHLAAGTITSQSSDAPLWQQQAHTFYAQAFANSTSQLGVSL